MIVLLVGSVVAVTDTDENCEFWCKVGKVLWGDSENRAGRSWFDRGNIVGEASAAPVGSGVGSTIGATGPAASTSLPEAKQLAAKGDFDESIEKFKESFHALGETADIPSAQKQELVKVIEQGIKYKQQQAAQNREQAKKILDAADEDDDDYQDNVDKAERLNSQADSLEYEADGFISELRMQEGDLQRSLGEKYLPSEALIQEDLRKGKITYGEARDRYEKRAAGFTKKLQDIAVSKYEGKLDDMLKDQRDYKISKSNVETIGKNLAKDKAKYEKLKTDRKVDSEQAKNLAAKIKEDEKKLGQEQEKLNKLQSKLTPEEVAEIEKNKKDKKKAEKQKDSADARSLWWWEGLGKAPGYSDVKAIGSLAGGIANLAAAFGSYSAISNLLFPDATQTWMENANVELLNEWADLPTFWGTAVGKGLGVDICEADDDKRSKTEGSGTAFVKTKGDTYQFVGTIKAEMYPNTNPNIPIQCIANPDEEDIDNPFICSNPDLICKDETFCYVSEDDELPAKGYFYKIQWGVSAPADEKHTPFIDENNKSVKFNIELRPSTPVRYIYELVSESGIPIRSKSVIKLTNGESDQDLKVAVMRPKYEEACIVFDDNGFVTDYYGDEVKEICAMFKETNKGYLEYDGEAQSSSTLSSSNNIRSTIG